MSHPVALEASMSGPDQQPAGPGVRDEVRRDGVIRPAYAFAARNLIRLLTPALLVFLPIGLLATAAPAVLVDGSAALLNGVVELVGAPGTAPAGVVGGGAVLINPAGWIEVTETAVTENWSRDRDSETFEEDGRPKPRLDSSDLRALYAGPGGRVVMLMDDSAAAKLLTCLDGGRTRTRLSWAEPVGVAGGFTGSAHDHHLRRSGLRPPAYEGGRRASRRQIRERRTRELRRPCSWSGRRHGAPGRRPAADRLDGHRGPQRLGLGRDHTPQPALTCDSAWLST
jgi:hypothetical protein